MYSKVMVLLWERWMRTRWAIIVSCLLPIIGLLIYMSNTTQQQNIVQDTLLFWLVFCFLIMVLLAGQCEMRHMDLAFPNRIFKLPVSTTTLFTVHLSYGITSIALPFLLFWGVEKLISDTNIIPWSSLFFFETLYVVLQTLSWLGGPWRFLYVLLLLAGLYLLKKFSIMLNLPIGENIRYMIIIMLSCVVSYWSLFMCRHGAWLTNWKWVSSFVGVFKMRASKPFSSAMQARIKLEQDRQIVERAEL